MKKMGGAENLPYLQHIGAKNAEIPPTTKI
jgi:hypothetical protein